MIEVGTEGGALDPGAPLRARAKIMAPCLTIERHQLVTVAECKSAEPGEAYRAVVVQVSEGGATAVVEWMQGHSPWTTDP